MYVCVFGIYVLKIVVERWFWELKKCLLDPWLSCMLDCIHICVFPFLKNYFQAISTLGYLSRFSTSSYRNLDSFSTVRWINRDFFWILDSCSIDRGWLLFDSISTPLDPSRFFFSFFACIVFYMFFIFLSFILSSIASCFITFMHFYGFFVNMWFLFKILHVRGRNTCLCKGEMCFIL